MPVQMEEIVSDQQTAGQTTGLTPDQIRIVVDKVYAMLLNELRIEAERSRPTRSSAYGRRSGKGAN